MKSPHLTHEVLTTLLAEVCAIINTRPLSVSPSILLAGRLAPPTQAPTPLEKRENLDANPCLLSVSLILIS